MINLKVKTMYFRPRLHYTVFIKRRYRNVPFWPTVYTVPFSYPVSNEDCCIRKYLNVYTMPFSYENISIQFSYENGSVNGASVHITKIQTTLTSD